MRKYKRKPTQLRTCRGHLHPSKTVDFLVEGPQATIEKIALYGKASLRARNRHVGSRESSEGYCPRMRKVDASLYGQRKHEINEKSPVVEETEQKVHKIISVKTLYEKKEIEAGVDDENAYADNDFEDDDDEMHRKT